MAQAQTETAALMQHMADHVCDLTPEPLAESMLSEVSFESREHLILCGQGSSSLPYPGEHDELLLTPLTAPFRRALEHSKPPIHPTSRRKLSL